MLSKTEQEKLNYINSLQRMLSQNTTMDGNVCRMTPSAENLYDLLELEARPLRQLEQQMVENQLAQDLLSCLYSLKEKDTSTVYPISDLKPNENVIFIWENNTSHDVNFDASALKDEVEQAQRYVEDNTGKNIDLETNPFQFNTKTNPISVIGYMDVKSYQYGHVQDKTYYISLTGETIPDNLLPTHYRNYSPDDITFGYSEDYQNSLYKVPTNTMINIYKKTEKDIDFIDTVVYIPETQLFKSSTQDNVVYTVNMVTHWKHILTQ